MPSVMVNKPTRPMTIGERLAMMGPFFGTFDDALRIAQNMGEQPSAVTEGRDKKGRNYEK